MELRPPGPDWRAELRGRLAPAPGPLAEDPSLRWRAATALVLRQGDGGLEVLLILRSLRDGDPWSGHVALPGGRVEREDADLVHTARRESLEELGLELSPSELLGLLPSQPGWPWSRLVDFAVTPAVFAIDRDPELVPDPAEVAEAFWVPLTHLRVTRRFWHWWRPLKGLPLAIPARMEEIQLGERRLWGMTWNTLTALLERLPEQD